ncbi:MAG: hypothetical protein J7J07_04330, partial [Syntrophobacterales bacterium]|nr:hypothetical protein [Syntrophobacterales bacterium]
RVQGSILVPGLHLGCAFTGKASASSGLKQNLEPNWQLFAKMSIFDEGFRSLMLPLSLTLSHEPVNGYEFYNHIIVSKDVIDKNAFGRMLIRL